MMTLSWIAKVNPRTAALAATAAAALPLLLWFVAHRSTLAWLGRSFTMARPQNLALLAAVAVAVAIGFGSRSQSPALERFAFRARFLPLALLAAAGLLDLTARRLSSLEQASVSFFVLGTFGLLGCHMTSSAWRRALPAALLAAAVLPFGARFGTGLGYPARVATAQMVEDVLASTGVASISMHDVIVLENGIAHVDLPCSGLKSLWTGALFFLAASWLAGRRLGPRWIVAFGVFELVLFLANTTRVLVLVVCGLVLGRHELASVLHVPLGVFGFLVCCAAGIGLLRLCPGGKAKDEESAERMPEASATATAHPVWVGGVLAVLAVFMPPLSPVARAQPTGSIDLPAGVIARALELTPTEKEFFASRPGTKARKWSFSDGNLEGSALIVSTASWQTHHAPELCLAAAGLEVNAISPERLDGGLAFHWLALENGTRSAVYWFQAPGVTTGSLLHRFWRDLLSTDRRWVLVSVLFDSAPQPDAAELRSLLRRIHHNVDAELRAGV